MLVKIRNIFTACMKKEVMNNMTTSYEKPSLKFVSVRNEESVADTCWGGHGNRETWYYDTEGAGYVSFQIGGDKCHLSLDQVTYYTDKNDSGTPLTEGSAKYIELQNALVTSGGESGNPFKGQGAEFPTDPNPSWS